MQSKRKFNNFKKVVLKLLSVLIVPLLIMSAIVIVFVEPVKADSIPLPSRAIPGYNIYDSNNSLSQFTCSIINNTEGTTNMFYGNTLDIEFNGTLIGGDLCYLYYPLYTSTFDAGSGYYEVDINYTRHSATAIQASDLTLESVALSYAGLWVIAAYNTPAIESFNMSNMSYYDVSGQWEPFVGWFWVNSSFSWNVNTSRNAVLNNNADTMNITIMDSSWDPITDNCYIDIWQIDGNDQRLEDYNLAYHKELTAAKNGLWVINNDDSDGHTENMSDVLDSLGVGAYQIIVYEDEAPGHTDANTIYGESGGYTNQGTRGYNITFGYTDSTNWSGRFINSGTLTQIRSYNGDPVYTDREWADSNDYATTYRWETCGPFNPPEIYVNSTYLFVVTQNATLKGYVNDSEGNGIENTNVTAYHNSYGLVNYTLTDSNGYYELNLTSGIYDIYYSAETYEPNSSVEDIADSATNWTNVSLSGGSPPPPEGGGPNTPLNQWQFSLTPRHLTNGSTGLFNFTLPRENGWDQQGLRVKSLNISFPANFTYDSANWTSINDPLNQSNQTEFAVSNGANWINWTTTRGDGWGFEYNATEYFSFVAAATGGLESGTFAIEAVDNNTVQTFTATVFLTTNFSFNGSIFDINGNPLEGATGRMTIQSFVQDGPPVSLGLFSGNTNSAGNFTIAGIPTLTDPDAPPDPSGGGGNDLFYQLSAYEFEEGTPYARNISPSLPNVAYMELNNMLNNPQMYLKPAITYEINVVGPQWNWSTASIDGYAQKNFQVMTKDLALGFSVQENNTNSNGHLFSVPANRNYSFSIFPDMSFPVSVRLNSAYSTCQASGDLNQTGVTVNYDGFNGSYLINITVNASYSRANLTGNFTGVSDIADMRVVAYTMEDQDMVFESWALPFNLGNETSGGSDDNYSESSGRYNITLPATQATSYIMLRAYAKDASENYYMGSFIISAVGQELNVSEYNFLMQPMYTGSGLTNRSVTSNNVSNQWSEEIVVNTTAVTFQLVNESGVPLTSDSSSVEIKRLINGVEYKQFVQASSGQFNISLVQGESIEKLTIFSQQYAPLSTRISSSVLSGSANTSSVNCTDGLCNITLQSFGEFDPLGKELDFYMSIFKSNTSCNVADPPDYCDMCPSEGEMGKSEFSPFNAILKGDVNMMIKSYVGDDKIVVYYVNVDLLASGPPDAAFTDSATESAGGLEAAWQFGSQGPDIYDYVIIGFPYSEEMENRQITIKVTKLYDVDFNLIWDNTAGDTIDQINTDDNLSDYRDYLNTSYEAYLNGTGVVCNESDQNFSSGLGYKDTANNLIWIKIPHFSGLGPVIYYSGGNQSYITDQWPYDGATNITINPDLYVLCIDNDTEDTMNATWSSNSSGDWVEFGTDNDIANDTNITQQNTNFNSPGTKYWWRVNLTDGNHNWYNATYNLTTNYEPYQSGASPASGLTNTTPNGAVFVVVNDNDSTDNITANWLSNSTGAWTVFGINASVFPGTNITQTTVNLSNASTTYWWSCNITDGTNWSNATYSFTTNNAPTLSSADPLEGAQYEELYPPCNITVDDSDSDVLTVYFFERNGTGIWNELQTNSSVNPGTEVSLANFSNGGNYSDLLNWSVNVTDGKNWTNATYQFTTRNQNLPGPPTGFSASASSTSAISIGVTLGQRADTVLVIKKEGGYPTSRTDGTNISNSSSTSISSAGLTSSTTYYYRAWSWNATSGLWSIENVSASATTNAESGQSSPPPGDDTTTDDTTDDTADDEDTSTTTSDETVNEINEDYGLDLTEAFYANDTDGDGVVDSFTDPNGVLKKVDNTSIGGNNTFLISTADDPVPEFFWNADDDTITAITYAPGTISHTIEDTEAETVTYVVIVEKTDWIFIEIDDPYPAYAVTVQASNGTEISSDRIWRENNKVYVLDDPSTQYNFIYGLAIIVPTFDPVENTVFSTTKPVISFTFEEEVELISALFGGNNVLDQIATEDNLTFVFTAAADYQTGEYILRLTAKDNESNLLYTNTTYTVSIPVEDDEEPEPVPLEEGISPIWIVLIVVIVIILIIFLLFKTGFLYIDEEKKGVSKDKKKKP